MPGICTFNGTSTLTIQLRAEDNNSVIKCAVEQELATSDMFRQSQPGELVVYYQVKNVQITKSPNLPNFAEGASDITLTCSSEGNPARTYTWHKDTDMNTTLTTGNTFRLQKSDVIVNNTGNYVCVAHNSFNGKDHELTATEHIQIDYTTTPAPTTTPTTITADPTSTRDQRTIDDGERKADNSGLVGGIIFLCLLQVSELFVVFILYKKGIVVFRLQKEKVYEDATNNRPDNHVYSTMNSSTGDNAQGDDRYYNL